MTSTLPPPQPTAPLRRGQRQTRTIGRPTGLIAGFAVLAVAVIFIIQNAHAASIGFGNGQSSPQIPAAAPAPADDPLER
jgi:hypothetical protein